MKKIICFFIWLNIGMCFFGTFTTYSKLTYKNIHEDKVAVQVTKPDSISNSEFIEELKYICEKVKSDIFYERIEGATTGHPIYYIYKTNIKKDFLKINLEENKNLFLKRGEYFSIGKNNITNKKYLGKIVGSTLINDVVIYSIEELSDIDLDRNTFYIDKKDQNKMLLYFEKKEMSPNIINSTNEEEGDFFWRNSQIILLFLLMLIIFYYFFSSKKSIIIKKINGYGNKEIILDDLKNILTYIMLDVVFFSVLIYIKWTYKVLIEYLTEELLYILIIIFCIILEFFLSSMVVFTQSRANYIKGKLKYTEIKIICIISKGVIILLLAFQIGQIEEYIYNYWITVERFTHMQGMLDNKFYLPFNTLSSDIDLNYEYYSLKCSEFFKDLIFEYGEKNIIVIDTDLYKDVNSDKENNFVTINETYLNNNHLSDSEGNKYLIKNINYQKNYIFLPDNIENIKNGKKKVEDFVNYLEKQGEMVEIKYYKAGSKLRTYDIDSGNNQGIIYDAFLFLPNRELMSQYALSLFSNYNILINENHMKDIEKIIKKNRLQNIILETESVSKYYKIQLLNWRIEIIVEVINIISLVAVYILSIFLLTYIFLYNERKNIVIKKLYGFGLQRYIGYYLQNIILFLIIINVSFMLKIQIYINIIGFVIDLIIFNFLCKCWENKNIVQVLKGE